MADRLLLPSRSSTIQRILRGAGRPPIDLAAVLATPPTISFGGTTAASTINASATNPQTLTGSIPINDPRIVPIGGPFAANGSAPQMSNQTFTRLSARIPGHVSGFKFGFYGQAFDFSAFLGSAGLMGCVTDPLTGIRQRFRAADYTSADYGGAGFRFIKFDFGSAALREIETYTNSSPSVTFGAINIAATGAQLFPVRNSDHPQIAFLWDSWGAGVLTGATNPLRMAVPDYIAAQLGSANPLCVSDGGTGYLGTNTGAGSTYRQRVTAGDLDLSRIGAMDIVIAPMSVNDVNLSGNTPAATQAEMALTLPLIRAAQPGALIVVTGPQYTSATAPAQSWYDAAQAAVAAYVTATNDQMIVYLDNSPAGENWMNASITATMFTGTDNHVNDVGKVYYAKRFTASLLSALRLKFGV